MNGNKLKHFVFADENLLVLRRHHSCRCCCRNLNSSPGPYQIKDRAVFQKGYINKIVKTHCRNLENFSFRTLGPCTIKLGTTICSNE